MVNKALERLDVEHVCFSIVLPFAGEAKSYSLILFSQLAAACIAKAWIKPSAS